SGPDCYKAILILLCCPCSSVISLLLYPCGASMNLKQLRYFGSVARNRSVTKASAELAITQPAISRQLALLEAEIGAPLFVRHHRGVALTKAGELLLSRSEYILRTLVEIQSEVSSLTTEPSGELRIGYPPALSHVLISSPLRAF